MNFLELLEELGITLNDEQIKQFELYYELLVETNKVMNLTAITERDDVYLKHFYDSITLSKVIKNEEVSICDIGAGAGFPSIPLKICFPNIKITIVDALAKRIGFLTTLVNKLGLKGVTLVHGRAEDYCKANRESFDYVTARAVARLNTLSEFTLPLVKVNGKLISMKSDYTDELNEAKNAINILGGKFNQVVEFSLPIEGSKRALIIVDKVKETNKKYPRNFNLIKKNPL